MRAVLATVGTRGDVQPMLALAQALVVRGHSVLVACPPSFGDWVRSHGIEHAALGEDLSALLEESDGKLARSLRGMRGYFAQQMALQGPRLVELAQGADVIAGTAMAWMVRSVAEKLDIPARGVLPSTCLPSRLHPPPLMPFYGLPQAVNAALWWLSDSVQDRLMLEPVNQARARLDLQPVASFTHHLFAELEQVIAADPEVLPPDPAWQGRYPYIGFAFLEDASPLEAALERWLAAGEPPVYVGFGSMTFGARERVARAVRQALAEVGRRCLVSGAIASALVQLGPLPPHFFVVRDAPHAALFPRCAAVVHHGGSGTMAAALRAGVPQVILPVMLDQFHHAHHLLRLGLAPTAPKLANVTARKLARALQEALALPVQPRKALAQRLQQSDAGAAFAAQLERAAVVLGARARSRI